MKIPKKFGEQELTIRRVRVGSLVSDQKGCIARYRRGPNEATARERI